MEALAQGHGGVEEAQARRGGVEVELVTLGAAAEALVDMAFQVRREGAAACRGGPMHRTGTADLILSRLDGDESEQVEDVRQRDHGTDFAEADTRHGGELRWRAVVCL